MYKIAYLHKNNQEERDLYIPGDQDYCLTSAKLDVACGASGQLDISIPYDNPARQDIECLTDEIIVYRNDAEIWRGRPITLQVDFDLTGSLTCEGILSYLYDTYYPPFEFQGSPKELLQDVIDNHNSNVEKRKQFTLGEVTVEDSNDYINRSSIYYNRSVDILNEKFIKDSLGGYFRVRVEGDTRYLDYLTAYNTESGQPVQYGYNLLDIAQNVQYNDVATVILPLGAKLEDEDGMETDERLTVASVNNGNIYIVDQGAVDTYGWIVVEAEWDDVTEPQNLYNKGYEYLTQVTSPISKFTIQAVDLSLADPELDPINLGDFVQIRVDSHGVNQWVELTGMNIDLLDPVNSVLNFGTDANTLTGSTSSTSRTIQESLGNLSMRVTNLSANVINAVYANIENIVAGTITTDFIRAAVADLGYVTADWVAANYANIEYLEANYATILELQAAFESVELLDADVANIKNVLAGNVGTGDLQTIVLTSENAFIEEAVIVNALMDTVLASVLTAGVIYTDYIKIADNEGQYLWIDGSTLQFKDENGVVRVQIGMDGDGNYNYYLWDENGVLIWNPLGLTEEGLTGNGAIIKDEAVADDANISGYKLNIQEVAQILNENGDLVLNATQVLIDGETLDYQLTQITKQIEGLETEGLVKIETYYSLGTADAPYHAPGDDSTNARLGDMILGQAVLGESGTGWTLIQPTPDDGQYVWFSIKGTYLDGSVQWTDPTLLTDAATRTAVNMLQTEFQVVQGAIESKIWMEDIYTATDELSGEISDIISEQYGQLTVLIDAIDARVGTLTTTVADNYEALNSSITAITLDLEGITAEIRNVSEWASESLTELSEQYAQVQIDINNINSDIVSVRAELAENYSTTTQVTNLIDQAVTESSSTILQEVSYSYVAQNDMANYLEPYYTSTQTDALILAQADETSSTILSQVSATYATQDYVTDALKDLDLDGVTNIETYYAVSKSDEIYPGDNGEPFSVLEYKADYSDWEDRSRSTYSVESSDLGTYLRVSTYVAGNGPSHKLDIALAGDYHVKFKAATEAGYEERARAYVGIGNTNSIGSSWSAGLLSSTEWTELDATLHIAQSYVSSGTIYLEVANYISNCPTLFSDIEVLYEGDAWSTEYPSLNSGEFLWVRYLVTYNDGHTEWTDPFCASTSLEDYPTIETMTATIEQYVDSAMASIKISVSGSLGSTASITMTTNGGEATASLDLSKVREAFANDNSSIEITAGTILFASNTLLVTSSQFTLTSSGAATFSGTLSAPSGNIGGWTIGTSSLYNGTSSMTSTTNGTYIGTNGIRQYNSGDYMNITSAAITNGNSSSNNYVELYNGSMTFYNAGTDLGYYGTSNWQGTTTKGLVIGTEYENGFIAFSHKESSSASAYAADLLFNYRISTSVIGYSEPIISYDDVRVLGAIYLSSVSTRLNAFTTTSTSHYGFGVWDGDFWADNSAWIGGTWYTGSYKLGVTGNAYFSGTVYEGSDQSLKGDIKQLDRDDMESILDTINPVSYTYNDDDEKKIHFGVTYQNIREALEADGLNPDDYAITATATPQEGHVQEVDKEGKPIPYEETEEDVEPVGAVAYDELIAPMLYEIQQLKAEVKELKEKVSSGGLIDRADNG